MSSNRMFLSLAVLVLSGLLIFTSLVGLAAALIYPELPSLDALTNYRPKQPLRVWSADNYLLAEYGEERRDFIKIKDTPKDMQNAILAIEDVRFYKHGGVDTKGILRAAVNNILGGSKEGASTITMQVARNFYLSNERSFKRKINEALLAIKIEHSLNKEQILELYINQIFLGQRSYGFAAAAQIYFGKPLNKLNLAEIAVLAGLPKAPTNYNPFQYPKRAISRQRQVLANMKRYKFITEAQYEKALATPLHFKSARETREFAADYVGEMVRQVMFERYKDSIYSSGMNVYTTISKDDQQAANKALMQGVLDYDQRHGFRGPEKQLAEKDMSGSDAIKNMEEALDEFESFNGLTPAVVTKISKNAIQVHSASGEDIKIEGPDLAMIQSQLNSKDPSKIPAKLRVKVGSIIRILQTDTGWKVSQLPQVESAIVALDSNDGAIKALVGGFNFSRNKFNHVTQAWRQPGSSFKPFIYSAALEKGYSPASVFEDEPISFSAQLTGSGEDWNPHNFDGKYEGPMRLRTALTKSKNMVSIRLLNAIGVEYAQNFITQFGFAEKDHPPYLTLALGAGSVTVWKMAEAYAVFSNGGYRIKPYLISKITDSHGKVIETAQITRVGENAERAIDERNAFIMTSMMRDVTRIGTAAKASQLGRFDLAGKTGTTNNHVDAWFAGYNPKHVAVVWMGYDQPRTLGSETGGSAALPIWINYMATALKDIAQEIPSMPDGVTQIKINLSNGRRANDNEGGLYEYFYEEYPPSDKDKDDHGPIKANISEPTDSNQLY
ncbi:MAG: penicillin-binding protein 1A [Candidatus Methylopumilus sp.]|jgi:penicillin-binding protein 1A|nr:penicillin-binding protein 1A [Candidatus Methylopumilus sp.]NBW61111.1 penicillin-binding protein 1A [Methylophilaceae bacterium]